MNILLANYNFFPFGWGGSEVYVYGLARYLQRKGHQVSVVIALDNVPSDDIPIFEDDRFKVWQYYYEGTRVYRVLYPVSVKAIYSKSDNNLLKGWNKFFAFVKNTFQIHYDIFHLNGFTAIIGLSMLDAARNIFPEIKIIGSYHTPISCPKGTLMYFEKHLCNISPSPISCTACIIQKRAAFFPTNIAKWIAYFLPSVSNEYFGTGINLKSYIKTSIEGFQYLIKVVDHWIVHSQQIYDIMALNNVSKKNISIHRHGVAPAFLHKKSKSRPGAPPQIFAFVGRFEKIKGIITLLKAWLIMEEDKNVRQLWLIGDENAKNHELKSIVSLLKNRNDVAFLGKQAQSMIPNLLDQIHFLVVPSECVEIGPLVIHEAMARGVNVISSNIGGGKELCELYQRGCTTFNVGDISDLVKVLKNSSFINIYPEVTPANSHYCKIYEIYSNEK